MGINPVKLQRMQIGITQQQLASLANVSESTISKIETGRIQPDADVRRRIARALGIEPFEVGGSR